jgi:Mrp family chromosome partitioning ATPase
MSDHFRKFNQSSSQVSLHELQSLQLLATSGEVERRDSLATDTSAVVAIPDLSPSASPKPHRAEKQTSSLPDRGDLQGKPGKSIDHMDALFSDPPTDLLNGLTASDYDLRTEIARSKKLGGAAFKINEFTSGAEVARGKKEPHQDPRPMNRDTSPDGNSVAGAVARPRGAGTPTVSLGLAVATTFAEPEPQLIKRLLSRRKQLGSQILLFADVDRPERGASVCVQIALEIAAAKPWKILVVDADIDDQPLTKLAGVPLVSGWRECLQGETQLAQRVLPSERAGVAFLPPGIRSVDFKTVHTSEQHGGDQLIRDLRQEFDVICVSLGTAFGRSLPWWGRNCDLSFLSLNPVSTGRSLARLAVQELQQNGARLEGCIVSYHELNPLN